MTDWQPKPCRRCGKPKPLGVGRGRQYCDDCQTPARQAHNDAYRDTARQRHRERYATPRGLKTVAAVEKNKLAPKNKQWCTGCETYRLKTWFSEASRFKCKTCRSKLAHASTILRKYGITADQYAAIKRAQGGKCAICQRATGKTKRLAVDHNHATGEVRGLLCVMCNKNIIGHLRDDIEALIRAVNYLRDPPARKVLNGNL